MLPETGSEIYLGGQIFSVVLNGDATSGIYLNELTAIKPEWQGAFA
jgi:hypothetical protein